MLYYIEQDSNTFNQYNEVMSVALVTNEQVIKALRNYNPWWRNPSAAKEEDRPQHRVAYHETLRIMQHKTIRRFAVLSGARRVGKTTILYQIINHLIDNGVNPRNIFYATFDNPVLKMAGVDMVLSAYDSMYPVEGVRYVFFDEIQYTENWELWMKVIYDSRKDIRLAATGSASPIIEDASTDSGTGRWTVIKIPTLSFYEYCQLLQLDDMPLLPDHLKITDIPKMENAEVADLMARFEPLVKHFNRYLTIGGFPELALSDDDLYAQRMLREDVVDKVIKRDVLTLFKVRSPLLMEKLFLYLCMNSTEIFSATTAAKELDNISPNTIESYVDALVKSNLIYMAYPIAVGSKSVLKGRPKIYIADAAIRNAVLIALEYPDFAAIPITTGMRIAAVPVLERKPLITPTITMIAMISCLSVLAKCVTTPPILFAIPVSNSAPPTMNIATNKITLLSMNPENAVCQSNTPVTTSPTQTIIDVTPSGIFSSMNMMIANARNSNVIVI